MDLNLNREVAALQRLTVAELRQRYAEVFGEATAANHRAWLIKRIAWRLQARAEGDLSERARQRAAELANDADLRLSPPRVTDVTAAPERTVSKPVSSQPDHRLPPPGTVLNRRYKGQNLQVQVLSRGFEFEGQVYGSLSAVAKAITGSHCNGFLFFKMAPKGGDQ
jgi:hypothetical protein